MTNGKRAATAPKGVLVLASSGRRRAYRRPGGFEVVVSVAVQENLRAEVLPLFLAPQFFDLQLQLAHQRLHFPLLLLLPLLDGRHHQLVALLHGVDQGWRTPAGSRTPLGDKRSAWTGHRYGLVAKIILDFISVKIWMDAEHAPLRAGPNTSTFLSSVAFPESFSPSSLPVCVNARHTLTHEIWFHLIHR